MGADSYGIVYLANVVDEQTPYRSFIVVKSSIPKLAFSLKKEEQIFKSVWEGESEQGRYFYNFLLEYAPHVSLDDLIHKKPLPETEVSVYARMIVKGLSHIHRKGIVHCDLKPENILVFPSLDKEIANYQLKIADFGLSKTKEEEADVELWKSKPRGTLSYLSLEAFFGHIDAPMDIWAPGCIVIKILTGFLAWGESVLHEDYLTYLVEHFGESPKKPQGIGFFCSNFLEKCFMKNPSKRWTTDMLLGPDGYAVGFLGQAVFFSMMALPKRSWSRAMSDLQWKKLKVLGAGSYGTVYLAIVVDEQTLGGCQEIIRCFGTDTTVEQGLCSHGSLDDLIHRKPLPETEVSVYARMSVKGLSHIHRKGLVHCDLKPENILVFPSLDKEIANYQLNITDFGLSKTKEEEADVELWKSKPRGTLSYLLPEEFSGHIDAPMDIWALGCIVIEMLTGLPAWGESVLYEKYLRYLVEHFRESPK
ncbi:hypothetical protein Ahy_A07g033805 [Arachis hypogaea]|uniref:Protein kinase domain-containing protein n=1 Tax=Arachis hypogaea TaxID=3818 RepID=A0A445CA99_ARAHY|nr:hypothetical protein Ahy_A07g033805 [Arachis hypogaea]